MAGAMIGPITDGIVKVLETGKERTVEDMVWALRDRGMDASPEKVEAHLEALVAAKKVRGAMLMSVRPPIRAYRIAE